MNENTKKKKTRQKNNKQKTCLDFKSEKTRSET